MQQLTIFINNESVYEFDRILTLEDEQFSFLDKMDSDMEKGIKMQGKLLANPDTQQRATFVVMNLIKALQQDNQAVISASCTYLVSRHPDVVEVHANDGDNAVNIEFIEE